MAEQIITKRCSACKEIKPLSEFYKHPKTTDKHDHRCKQCAREYARKWQSTEKGKESHNRATQKYAQSSEGKRYYRTYHQSKDAKIKRRKYAQAVNAVNNAIQAGKLPRPDSLLCHYCPKPAQQYHHHKGYAPEHWLDVVPVCIDCHPR